MRWRATAVSLLLPFAVLAVESDSPMKLVIVAGQSNVVGKGDARDLPEEYRKLPSNVKIFSNGVWEPLEAEAKFGPEVAMGHALAKAWPQETIGLIKLAKGGTSLKNWAPEEKGLYRDLIDLVHAARKTAKGALVAFVWGQGLGDAKSLDLAEHRAENLKGLIDSLRRDLEAPELPFIFSQMPSSLESGRKGVALIRKGNEEIARQVAHTCMISTEGVEMLPDKVHYNAAGQIEYGRRFAEAIQKLVKVNSAKPPVGTRTNAQDQEKAP